MSEPHVLVGIEVSKAPLDVAQRPTDDGWHVSHEEVGSASLVERLRTVQPTLVGLEATGGLEVPVTGALAEASLPVVVVHPRHARDVAKATGRLAKTATLAVGRTRRDSIKWRMAFCDIDHLREGNQCLSAKETDRLKLLFVCRCGETASQLSDVAINPLPTGCHVFFNTPRSNSIDEGIKDLTYERAPRLVGWRIPTGPPAIPVPKVPVGNRVIDATATRVPRPLLRTSADTDG